MARFRPGFHTSLASQFIDDVYYGRKVLHMGIGYVQPWGEFTDDHFVVDKCDCDCPDCINANGTIISVDFGDNANPHKDPGDEYFHETTIRGNMLYFSKIGADNISVVTNGRKWVQGSYYTQWDNTKDMRNLPEEQPFFVYNSQWQVFKCLYNNKGIKEDGTYELTRSMYEPSGVNYDVIQTADGYVWKYMYTIPMSLRNKFASNTRIPVQRAVQNTFYNRGAIEEIFVTNPGSGYSSEPKVYATIAVPQDPNGTQAQIMLFINDDTGSIEGVEIIDRGSGYTEDPAITIYDSQKTGTGKYKGNISAILTAHVVDGQLDTVSIVDCGIGYSADTATTITISGDGQGATAYPKIINGKIEGVVITNPGVGYTYADVRASCVYDTADVVPASFTTRIGGEILTNEQSVVEQLATPGQIYAIELTQGGMDYTSTTEVIVTGDGTGCTAHAEVIQGRVARVVVDNPGSGYTRATVSFNDPNRREPNPNPVAVAYAILPPIHGHGYNAVEELYGSTVALYNTIRNDNMLAGLNQEFRQFALFEDMRLLKEKTIVQQSEAIIDFDVTVEPITNTSGNLGKDSVVYIGQTPYRVIDINGNQFKLQQISSIFREILPTDSIVYTDSITNKQYVYPIDTVDNIPDIDKYSGTMLYSNNNTPFFMADNKTFGIRTYIKF